MNRPFNLIQLELKNSFKDPGMFPVAYKVALKKMRYYNARRDLKSGTDLPMSERSYSQSKGNGEVTPASIDESE